MRCALTCLAATITALVTAAPAVAQTNHVTYQGRLEDNGSPANGTYDMRFDLYDDLTPGAPDNQISFTLDYFAVPVVDGLFSVKLFYSPNEFDNSGLRFLQIHISPPGAGTYSTLMPRQEITSAPQANHALNANYAASANIANNITLPFSGIGALPAPTLSPLFNIHNAGATGYGIYSEGPSGGLVGWGGTFVSGFPAIITGSGLIGISNTSGVTGSSTNGTGVTGMSAAGTGGYFDNRNSSSSQYALHARSDFGSTAGLFEMNLSSSTLPALIATTNSTQNNVFAVKGIIESTSPGSFSTAVRGQNNGISGTGIGVWGSQAGVGYGVYGTSIGGLGVFGVSSGSGATGFNAGIRGSGQSGALAGYFAGNVHITGTLSKSSGSFIIDHPQDPENQTLSHSFVESPDMKNIYDGLIITDSQGNATITLPSYFNALNTAFRYQLTILDNSDDFILSKVTHQIGTDLAGPNAFAIRTSKPNTQVSWQVTGVRNDPYAQQNPILVESEKSNADKGKYLNPESYGQPREQGIGYAPPPAQRAPTEHN